MNQLTPEQIKTLEDAFSIIPERSRDFYCKFASMEGIQQQLDAGPLEWNQEFIFYAEKALFNEGLLFKQMIIENNNKN